MLNDLTRTPAADAKTATPVADADTPSADAESSAAETESSAGDGAIIARLGLVSDTHGWLDPEIADHFADVDLIFHAGDIGKEAVLDALADVAPVAAVRGNVDGGPLRDLPEELVIELAGKRIAMRHIAGSPKKPDSAAANLIAREAPDVFVCGHTHHPIAARVEETLWINPGAAGREGLHEERMVHILEVLADGEMKLLRIHLGPRGRTY